MRSPATPAKIQIDLLNCRASQIRVEEIPESMKPPITIMVASMDRREKIDSQWVLLLNAPGPAKLLRFWSSSRFLHLKPG